MRTNDEITSDHIEFLEAQVFTLELENKEKEERIAELEAYINLMQRDREFCLP